MDKKDNYKFNIGDTVRLNPNMLHNSYLNSHVINEYLTEKLVIVNKQNKYKKNRYFFTSIMNPENTFYVPEKYLMKIK